MPLRHVAEECPGGGVDLFGQEADIVGQGEDLIHEWAGPPDLAGVDEGADEPETAGDERALFSIPRRPTVPASSEEAATDMAFVPPHISSRDDRETAGLPPCGV